MMNAMPGEALATWLDRNRGPVCTAFLSVRVDIVDVYSGHWLQEHGTDPLT